MHGKEGQWYWMGGEGIACERVIGWVPPHTIGVVPYWFFFKQSIHHVVRPTPSD